MDIKYSLDFIFNYTEYDLDTFIAQFTKTRYENIYDKRYMSIYYLYNNDMLDKETETLISNNTEKFKEALQTSNNVQELITKLTQMFSYKKIDIDYEYVIVNTGYTSRITTQEDLESRTDFW